MQSQRGKTVFFKPLEYREYPDSKKMLYCSHCEILSKLFCKRALGARQSTTSIVQQNRNKVFFVPAPFLSPPPPKTGLAESRNCSIFVRRGKEREKDRSGIGRGKGKGEREIATFSTSADTKGLQIGGEEEKGGGGGQTQGFPKKSFQRVVYRNVFFKC